MSPTPSYSTVILEFPSETWMSEMFMTKRKLIKLWHYPKVIPSDSTDLENVFGKDLERKRSDAKCKSQV